MSKRVIVIIPEQEFELEIDEDDYDEWAEDTSYIDPLYDAYVHHVISDFSYQVEIYDGDKRVAVYGESGD